MQTLHNIESIRDFCKPVLDHVSGTLIPSGRRGVFQFWGILLLAGLVIGGTYAGVKIANRDKAPQELRFVGEGQAVDEKGDIVSLPDVDGINLAVASACPDTKTVDFQARTKNNKKTGTVEYLNVTGYLIPMTGENDPLGYEIGASSTYSTAITPVCDGKTKYKFVTVVNNESAFTMETIINEDGLFRSDYKKTFEVEKFGRLSYKAKDILADSWVYDDSDASNTDYDNATVTFKSTTDNSTATSLAADTQLQWQFWTKTALSNTQFGEDELPTYIAVDADTTDYQQPTVSIDGVGLTDVKKLPTEESGLTSIDLSMLSAYEYIFKVPDSIKFTSSNRILTFETISKSGVDPDVDILIRPLAKTRYLSQDGVTIKEGIFKDNSGNTEAASDMSQEITIDIS